MKTKQRRSKKSAFLADYRLEDRFLKRADKARGAPGLIAGTSPQGFPVLIKRWMRDADDGDSVLREIWQNEIRQLHRLAGYPGASDYIVRLASAGYDADGFYLVLDTDSRKPLQTLLDQSLPSTWLSQPRFDRNRAIVWANVRRIARGLGLLHTQGLLHRNLDAFSILGRGGVEPDFQLTGFEWSMRIVAAISNSRSRAQIDPPTVESFEKDWMQYALLVARLLQLDERRLRNPLIPPHDIAPYASVDEIRLLRDILQPRAAFELSGESLDDRIQGIVDLLSQQASGNAAQLHLALRLDQTSSLAASIHNASKGEIEPSQPDALLQFVQDDLSDGAVLEAVKNRWDPRSFRLVLRGRHLAYRLEDYQRSKLPSNWEFAFCTACDPNSDHGRASLARLELDAGTIRAVGLLDARDLFPRMRGRVATWDALRRDLIKESTEAGTPSDRFRIALTLVQVIELLFAVADIFPVTVLSSERTGDSNSDRYVLRVASRLEPDRAALSTALSLRPLNERLESALVEDLARDESKWTLTDVQHLGDRSPTDTTWNFSQIEKEEGKAELVFTGDSPVAFSGNAYLIPGGSIGRDAMLARRLRALRAIRDHSELLLALADARVLVTESHETITDDSFLAGLDPPKQRALKELLSVLPLYLVQGPPGVGKTFLLTELVRRQFAEDPTRRLLLSAQSHYAVDHLLEEIRKLENTDAAFSPLAVRCRQKDSDEDAGPWDLDVQTNSLLKRVAASAMFAKSKLQAQKASLAESDRPEGTDGASSQAKTAKRAFEALVLRAANLVFATTNSAELDRLIEERGQFDWAIVEESGKATGGELVAPLLLSHRRLLIGDHKQLPPFDSDKITALLRRPDRAVAALPWASSFIGRRLRDTMIDELLEEVKELDQAEAQDAKQWADLCGDAERALFLFQTLFEKEIARQEAKRGVGAPIASRLTLQHRMHPVIADLVSAAFYGDLKTAPAAEAKFLRPPPVRSSDPKILPELPVVWIDMPSLQHTPNMTVGEQTPRFHNPDEVDTVVNVMALLAATSGTQPSLAVLSPYAQQVRRLASAIARHSAQLTCLSSFQPVGKGGRFCHTVDSFQGSEADAVIISLVRNNQHGGLGAIGFLSDARRMNVLLSRARWRLVIVGSLKFLEEIAQQQLGAEALSRVRPLRTVLSHISREATAGRMAIIPADRLVTAKDRNP